MELPDTNIRSSSCGSNVPALLLHGVRSSGSYQRVSDSHLTISCLLTVITTTKQQQPTLLSVKTLSLRILACHSFPRSPIVRSLATEPCASPTSQPGQHSLHLLGSGEASPKSPSDYLFSWNPLGTIPGSSEKRMPR